MRLTVAITWFSLASCVLAQPSVGELSFLTGRWSVASDGTMREYTWSEPSAGTLFGVLRRSSSETTEMVEIIIIVEEDETLVIRFQQFSPSLQEIAPIRELTLSALTEDSVTFTAETGGVRMLKYSRRGADFRVQGTTESRDFDLLLQATD